MTRPSLFTLVLLALLAPLATSQLPISKVRADNTSLDGFGEAVAVDGTTAVAFGTLVDHEGNAVVLEWTSTGWRPSVLLPFVPVGWAADGLKYGDNVDIVGDTIFVGATGDPHIGINAGLVFVHQRDDNGTPFHRLDDTWPVIDQLLGGDVDSHFGFSVAAEGDLVVVGGPGRDWDRGWARVFERNDMGTPADPFDDQWDTFHDLDQPGSPASSQFGFDVALSGDLIAVTDPLGAGRVYTWLRVGDDWLPNGTVEPTSDDPAAFGSSVALDDGTLLVGHRGDFLYGSASFYDFDDGGTPADPADDAWTPNGTFFYSTLWSDFGRHVALEGDRALVSAVTLSFFFEAGGRVAVFERSGGAWQQVSDLAAEDDTLADRFGWSLDLQGPLMVTGAKGDGDQPSGSGAVWFVDLDAGDPWVDEGFGTSTHTTPKLVGWGPLTDGHDVAVKLLDALPGSLGWLVIGVTPLFAPFEGGTMVPTPQILGGPLVMPASGQVLIESLWPRDVPPGLTIWAQWWIEHPTLGDWSATNGMSIHAP